MVRLKDHPRRSLPRPGLPKDKHPSLLFYNFKSRPKERQRGKRLSTDYFAAFGSKHVVHPTTSKLSDLQGKFTDVGHLDFSQFSGYHTSNLGPWRTLLLRKNLRVCKQCMSPVFLSLTHQKLKEKDIRRRDGTPYATDCRRAIQANLRSNPHHPTLFQKDAKQPNMWRLCHTPNEPLGATITPSKKELKTEKHSEDDDENGPRTRAGRSIRCVNLLYFVTKYF